MPRRSAALSDGHTQRAIAAGLLNPSNSQQEREEKEADE